MAKGGFIPGMKGWFSISKDQCNPHINRLKKKLHVGYVSLTSQRYNYITNLDRL